MTIYHETAHKLIHAAEEELLRNDGTMEMSAVARHAGVSVGLAYHHFGSKTGLIAAVVDLFYEPLRDILLGTAIPLELEWAAREQSRTSAMVDHYYDSKLAPLIAGRLAREPEVLDIETAHMNALLQLGAKNIAQGQKQGLVDATLDPQVTVNLLMGGVHLALDQAVLAKKRPSRPQLKKQIWQFISHALRLPIDKEQA